MALHLAAKGPTEVVRYAWLPLFMDGDGLSSFTLTASGCTIDSSEESGDEVVFFVSGGSAGTTASITATANSDEGEYFSETLYIPIRLTTIAFAYTARDVVDFALRKVVGNGFSADSAEADDALERLNDMLADWRMDGCDIGVPAPLTLGTTLSIPDEYVSALKFNLRIACHDHYGAPITAYDADRADRGKRNIINRLTVFGDLASPHGLSTTTETVADLF